jgi:ribonuclease E
MTSKILINAVDHEECRIAKVTDSKLEEFHIESASREIIQGNIYKAIITRIEPSLQAVFVDYGAERHGFLQKHDIHRDYFHDSPNGDLSLNTIVKRGQEFSSRSPKTRLPRKGRC